MRTFTWTRTDDQMLRDMRLEGRSLTEIARAIGCDPEHVRTRLGMASKPAARAATDVAAVPRPVTVRRPGLIDLSKAPSALEARFARKRL